MKTNTTMTTTSTFEFKEDCPKPDRVEKYGLLPKSEYEVEYWAIYNLRRFLGTFELSIPYLCERDKDVQSFIRDLFKNLKDADWMIKE